MAEDWDYMLGSWLFAQTAGLHLQHPRPRDHYCGPPIWVECRERSVGLESVQRQEPMMGSENKEPDFDQGFKIY
jgi:hypothetical protein